MYNHTLLLAILLVSVWGPAACAEPAYPVPEVDTDVGGVTIEHCDPPYTLVVLLGRGQEGCGPEDGDCSGQILVAIVSAGDYQRACSGHDEPCSGNLVFVAVIASSDTETCEGQTGACNANDVSLVLMIGADGTKSCFIGHHAENDFNRVPLEVRP